jgi:pimeloyl-ACP methyl ester carboxylesterase
MAENLTDLSFMERMNASSCRYDQRFSYFFYVPKSFGLPPAERPQSYNLVVLIHGNDRSPEAYRNRSRDFAEATGSVILAPLFPAGLIDPGEMNNFNHLRYKGVEFDTVLIRMIEELSQRFPVPTRDIYLHGFSAGGQFVHRFFYLHPKRIRALSVGACAQVTLLDHASPWPKGLSDLEGSFGVKPDRDAYKAARIQMVIGGEDDFRFKADIPNTRMEILTKLKDNYVSNGLDVAFTVVPGIAHQGTKVLPAVFEFFASSMGIKGYAPPKARG